MRTKWLDEEGDPLPSSRMTWLDLGIAALTGLANLVETAGLLTKQITMLAQQHSNWDADNENFHEEVTTAIETIAGGEDG